MLLTLRTRLTIMLVGLLTVALLLAGGLLTWSVHHYALENAKRNTWQTLASVMQAGQDITNENDRHGTWYGGLAEAALTISTTGTIVLPDGQALKTDYTSTELPTEFIAKIKATGRAENKNQLFLSTSDGTILALELPYNEVRQLTWQVLSLFAGIAMFIIVLTEVAAWWLVRYSLRPLNAMALQAEQIDTNITQRLPVPKPRDEIRSLAESLNRMLTRLQDAMTKLSKEEARTRAFAADASHELRTPLAAILGSLEVLERAGDDPEVRLRLSGNLRRESRRAARLVDDLLTLNRLDAGEGLKLEQIALQDLLAELTDTAHDLAPHLNFELEAEPLSIKADKARIEGAIWNLLRNAIAATPEDECIILKAKKVDQNVQISVSNPAQLSPDFLPRLFDRFARGPANEHQSKDGVGLGLAIVQAIAKAHGGEAYAQQGPELLEVGIRLPLGYEA